jgi:O-antigen/teichoic acid export membrane protein
MLAVAPALGRSLGSSQLGDGLVLFSVAVASLIVGNLIAAIFQGFANVTPNALFLQVVNPGLFLGFLGVALVVPPRRVTFVETLDAYALSAAVTLAAMVLYTVRRLPRGLARGEADPRTRAKLFQLAAPLFVTGVMVAVAGYGDTLVLGAFHYAQVGTYTASLTFARLVQVGISAASYIFLPVASAFLARGDRRAVRLTYVTVTKWLTVVSLPLFVVFVFLPSSSLRFVYGPNYASIILPLQVVVTGAFLYTILGPASMAQVAAGQARLVAINSIVAGAADVVVALALVPAYGAVGAAVAWSTANVLYVSLCLGELYVSEGYHPFRRDFVVPLLATGVPSCAVLAVLHPHLPLVALPAVVVGLALAFALIVAATRSVDEGDRLLLEAVERLLRRRVPLVRRWAALAGRHRGPS